MHAPRTEELLSRIRRVCDEEEPAEDVVPLIESSYHAMEQTRNFPNKELALLVVDSPEGSFS